MVAKGKVVSWKSCSNEEIQTSHQEQSSLCVTQFFPLAPEPWHSRSGNLILIVYLSSKYWQPFSASNFEQPTYTLCKGNKNKNPKVSHFVPPWKINMSQFKHEREIYTVRSLSGAALQKNRSPLSLCPLSYTCICFYLGAFGSNLIRVALCSTTNFYHLRCRICSQ